MVSVQMYQVYSIRISALTEVQRTYSTCCQQFQYIRTTDVFTPQQVLQISIVRYAVTEYQTDQTKSDKQHQTNSCFQTFSKFVGYLMWDVLGQTLQILTVRYLVGSGWGSGMTGQCWPVLSRGGLVC